MTHARFTPARTAFLLSLTAGAALAHSGVKDADVLARMEQMKEIGQSVGTLADMARGKTAFDTARAETAREALVRHAAAIPDAFRNQATDPKSEALPAIWTDWDDFTRIAADLERAASELDTGARADLGDGLKRIGKTCGSCHARYRIEK